MGDGHLDNMAIYTRTGDNGETSLANGSRVPKNSDLIMFIGMLDELNSHLGICNSHMRNNFSHDFSNEILVIENIQNDLFVIGSISASANLDFDVEKNVSRLEKLIDEYEEVLPKLTNFILPGGSLESSKVQLARACCRKSELFGHGISSQNIKNLMPYLNRLSDFLFVLARFLNHKQGITEPIWKTN